MSALPKRENLRRLVELLPERDLDAAERVLEGLIALEQDPVRLAIANAPYDDEPVTPEEEAAVQRGRAQAARGELVADADLWQDLDSEA